jgi:hypothetical protein
VAYSVTLETLRAACLDQADEQGYGYIDNTQLDRMINRSWARLYARIAKLAEDDYTSDTTIATVAAQEEYSLPADFLTLRHIEVDVGATRPLRMRKFSLAERPLLEGPWAPGQMICYRIVGPDTIRFLPTPTGVHTVTVFYIPAPDVLVATSDAIDARSGWDDWIVYDVVAKLGLKQEADVATPIALRDDVWKEDIAPHLGTSDEADPETVLDVEDDWAVDDGGW